MPLITRLSQLDLTKCYPYVDYLTWRLDEFAELIKGQIHRVSPAPRRQHQEIFGYFFGTTYAYLLDHTCKVYHVLFDVRLTTAGSNGDDQITTVVQPDICVVCHPQKLDDKGCLGAPNWIIEILSPDNATYDI